MTGVRANEGDDGRPEKLPDDLLCGLAPKHIRYLCENPFEWKTGRCYTPAEIGEMTLDMVWMLLANIDDLRSGPERIKRVNTLEAVEMVSPDEDGKYKGRAADGTPIRAELKGKSLARRLMEEEEARKNETPRQRRARKRRSRREARAITHEQRGRRDQ